jgi:glycosyltransferase involved in cell wall biosynthesis
MKRLQDTIDAIDSILKQTYSNIEIIVAVDHNKELMKILKQKFPEKVLFAFNSTARGLSETRNEGVRKSTGDIIAFIDDDAIADKRWIESLVSNYTDSNVLGVGGKLIPLWKKKRPIWFPEELDWIVGCTYKGHPEVKVEVRNVIGCNMSFRREVFSRIGYFNSKIGRLDNIPLTTGEDTEYCIRLRTTFPNGNILFDPYATAYHKVDEKRESIKYVLKRSYGEGITKSIINKSTDKGKILKTENTYLMHLLLKSIPQYIGKSFLLKNSSQNVSRALILSMAIIATGLGYLLPKGGS